MQKFFIFLFFSNIPRFVKVWLSTYNIPTKKLQTKQIKLSPNIISIAYYRTGKFVLALDDEGNLYSIDPKTAQISSFLQTGLPTQSLFGPNNLLIDYKTNVLTFLSSPEANDDINLIRVDLSKKTLSVLDIPNLPRQLKIGMKFIFIFN